MMCVIASATINRASTIVGSAPLTAPNELLRSSFQEDNGCLFLGHHFVRIAQLALLGATGYVFRVLVEPGRLMIERRACRARWDRLVIRAQTVRHVLPDKGFIHSGTIHTAIFALAGTSELMEFVLVVKTVKLRISQILPASLAVRDLLV